MVRCYKITDDEKFNFATSFKVPSFWIRTFACSSDGKWLVPGADKSASCYRITDDKEFNLVTELTDHTDVINKCVFRPDDKFFASASNDKTVCLYKVAGGKFNLVTKLTDHTQQITDLAFSPDDRWLVSGSYDKTVCCYDFEKLQKSIERFPKNLPVGAALLLNTCFKNKVSLQDHIHLYKHFFDLPEDVQKKLVEKGYVKLEKTENLLKLVKKSVLPENESTNE